MYGLLFRKYGHMAITVHFAMEQYSQGSGIIGTIYSFCIKGSLDKILVHKNFWKEKPRISTLHLTVLILGYRVMIPLCSVLLSM